MTSFEPERLAAERLSLHASEAQRAFDRVEARVTIATSVLQYMIAAAAAGIAVATRSPIAIAAVPLFFNAWLFHAFVIDRDTRKLIEYRRYQEQAIEALIGPGTLCFESDLSHRETLDKASLVLYGIYHLIFAQAAWLWGLITIHDNYGSPWWYVYLGTWIGFEILDGYAIFDQRRFLANIQAQTYQMIEQLSVERRS